MHATNKHNREAVCFLVASHGLSASNWLAYALNHHDDVACRHGMHLALANDRDALDLDLMYQTGGIGPVLDKVGEINRTGSQIRSSCLPDIYRNLAQSVTARAVGTVHTFRLRDLPARSPEMRAVNPPLIVMNLIRHPVELVASGHAHFQRVLRVNLHELQWTLSKLANHAHDEVEAIARRHGVFPGEPDFYCFAGACMMMRGLALDAEAVDRMGPGSGYEYRGAIQKEAITSDPDVLRSVFDILTRGSACADEDYLSSVYRLGAINPHTPAGRSGSPEQTFSGWSDWQRDLFCRLLDRFGLRSFYEKEGYKMDLLYI